MVEENFELKAKHSNLSLLTFLCYPVKTLNALFLTIFDNFLMIIKARGGLSVKILVLCDFGSKFSVLSPPFHRI